MGSTSDFAKKAAWGTTKGIGKLLWKPTKKIGKFAWRVTRALHPIASAGLLTLGCVSLLLFPPLGVVFLAMAATSYLLPAIGRRLGKLAADLFPKAAKAVNRSVNGEPQYGYRKALKPGEEQRPLGEAGPNQAFNGSHTGHFNDRSSDRRWRESFDDHRDNLDRQGLDFQEQLNKASHERLGTMNPFNSGGKL